VILDGSAFSGPILTVGPQNLNYLVQTVFSGLTFRNTTSAITAPGGIALGDIYANQQGLIGMEITRCVFDNMGNPTEGRRALNLNGNVEMTFAASPRPEITNNTFANWESGIYLATGFRVPSKPDESYFQIKNNIFLNCTTGISIQGAYPYSAGPVL